MPSSQGQHKAGWGLVLLVCVTSGCFGIAVDDTLPGVPGAMGGSGSGGTTSGQPVEGPGFCPNPPCTLDPPGSPDCPPTQWDCTGQVERCDYVPDEEGQAVVPVIRLKGPCRCDPSRPLAPSDCGEGELFVCGSLSPVDQQTPFLLGFTPLSCRCVTNAGFYCSHCMTTGLYASPEQGYGCGLNTQSSVLECGCGERAAQ